jgi:pyruvate kinase
MQEGTATPVRREEHAMDTPEPRSETARLLAEVAALGDAVRDAGATIRADLAAGAPGHDDGDGIANLAHYLALRQHDLRGLQRRLMAHGLSSLGRIESRVMPTLDAVVYALGRLAGCDCGRAPPDEAAFFAGERRLEANTAALFGPARPSRRGRVMATLPGAAAGDAKLVAALVKAGMDVARINCAHDDPDTWHCMAGNVRTAAEAQGVGVRVLMDIAGPKIRTAAVASFGKKAHMAAGDQLRLLAAGPATADAEHPFVAVASLPETVRRLTPGDRLRYNDGKAEGVVEAIETDAATIRLTKVKTGGVRLKPEKGLNLPDTALGLSPLTAKDEADLAAIVADADMVGYSFVSHADDIDLLEARLAALGEAGAQLGLVAKIERPEAIGNLPKLIARASGRRPFGVMIARGDLAAEIGFERLAEMQEEILWLCEAAHVPAIWATQVLEDLVKTGIPSRGEMTDAAMAARAECVMLNKGPELVAAVELLDRLLARMGDHVWKKTPAMRALRSW